MKCSNLRLQFSIASILAAVAWLGGLRGSLAGEIPPLLPGEAEITPVDRDHWSFRPLRQPSVPSLEHGGWSRTPIDQFILAGLKGKGLRPASEADRGTFLRRIKFDLVGLPPTADEVAQFVNDDRPDACERLVDRLLESPAYGQRWGQHWLDLARFAETDGFEHDKVRTTAWQYRDWVVDALNADLPYDQFLSLQIAGDELFPTDEQACRATGFCLSGPDMPDINSQDERRHVLLNEMTATVGAVFLGLQVGCTQCHDHKYDPISQADFYRLRTCFEPAIAVQKDRSVSMLKVGGQPVSSHLLVRGDWRTPGAEVSAGFPRIANPWNDLPVGPGNSNEGRRAALSRWLTRSDHVLTSRVIVNRVWQYHFGRGLSHTPSDFGLMGDGPWHGELLDWLACELIRRNWSLKQLHRLILSSSTYRQSVTADPSNQGLDRENRYLAHFERRRLSGEELRDAMFFAADVLDMRHGGAGVLPPLPAELTQTLLKNQWNVSPREADHYRRSIYVFARRNLRYPLFDVFDRPDPNATCPSRNRSTTAPQSLHLLNSQLSLDAARRLAGVVLAKSDNPDEQVRQAFLRALGRCPSETEQNQLTTFLQRQQELLRVEGRPTAELALPIPARGEADAPRDAALTDLCLALFNLSEFVYVE